MDSEKEQPSSFRGSNKFTLNSVNLISPHIFVLGKMRATFWKATPTIIMLSQAYVTFWQPWLCHFMQCLKEWQWDLKRQQPMFGHYTRVSLSGYNNLCFCLIEYHLLYRHCNAQIRAVVLFGAGAFHRVRKSKPFLGQSWLHSPLRPDVSHRNRSRYSSHSRSKRDPFRWKKIMKKPGPLLSKFYLMVSQSYRRFKCTCCRYTDICVNVWNHPKREM